MSLIRTPVDSMVLDTTKSLLDRVNLPDFQRNEDSTHVEQIYQSIVEQLQKGLEPKITGCMITVIVGDICYLLDGNHRLHAYKRILEEHEYDIKLYVQTIRVSDETEAELLFNQSNNSVPVAKMPKGIKRSDINQVANYFYTKYATPKKKIKPLFVATNANRPRINRVKFEEVLGQITKSGVQSSKLIETIDKYIEKLDQHSYSWFKKSSSDTQIKLEKMLDTADKIGCRLGMVRLKDIVSLFNINDPEPIFIKKSAIPKTLKTRVWDRYCGQNNRSSECPFCKDIIKLESFHCAHDTAEADGGDTTIDNLYPCCGSCNLSMGKQTYSEFMKIWIT